MHLRIMTKSEAEFELFLNLSTNRRSSPPVFSTNMFVLSRIEECIEVMRLRAQCKALLRAGTQASDLRWFHKQRHFLSRDPLLLRSAPQQCSSSPVEREDASIRRQAAEVFVPDPQGCAGTEPTDSRERIPTGRGC